MTLVRDSSTSQEGITPVPSEEELEASLPRALDDKEERLDSMVIERMADFLQKHTLKVKLSAAENLQRSLSEEGGLLLLMLLFFNRRRVDPLFEMPRPGDRIPS